MKQTNRWRVWKLTQSNANVCVVIGKCELTDRPRALTVRVDDAGDGLLPDEGGVHVGDEHDAPQVQIQIKSLVEERADVLRYDFSNRKSHSQDDQQLCVERRENCGQSVAV
jgi:hypothetical protein